jgi:hypothetical protein
VRNNAMRKGFLAIAITGALLMSLSGPVQAKGDHGPSGKVFVCKYVGQPGVDETLQTGQNPIDVSINAIPDYQGVGSYFADAQGRSYVLGPEHEASDHVPTPEVSECPTPTEPTTTSTTIEAPTTTTSTTTVEATTTSSSVVAPTSTVPPEVSTTTTLPPETTTSLAPTTTTPTTEPTTTTLSPTTTTISEPTTSTSVAVTTSSTVDRGVTTTVAPQPSSTTVVPPGPSVVPPVGRQPVTTLPRTGGDVGLLGLIGFILLVFGVLCCVGWKRQS